MLGVISNKMSEESVDNRPASPKEEPREHHKNKINYVDVTMDVVFDAEKPGSLNGSKDSDYKDKPLKNGVDFDDLLPHIGNFGKYQIILFVLLAPYTLFYVFVYFTQIFITLVPNDYWCNVPELIHLEASDR